MGRVGTHTRPGIIPKSTACAPLVHWNHYSSERGRGESPPAEARSTRLFPDQSKSTSFGLQIIQDFYLAFHSKLFLCPSILFILQFICIYIYVKLEKFTKKKEKYMRIFRSCQSYDNEVIMIQKCSEILSLEMTLQNFKKIVKGNDRGKESGSNVERSRHFTLDFATILFSPNRSWYGQRERERLGRKPASLFRPTVLEQLCSPRSENCIATTFTSPSRQRYRARPEWDKNVSVADIEESETARSPLGVCLRSPLDIKLPAAVATRFVAMQLRNPLLR